MAKYKGPFVFPTVDVAIFNDTETKLLLVRKPRKKLFQLLGGFADVKSPCYEDDAARETREEANINITFPVYVGSIIVDDERYRRKKDKIKTLLFKATYAGGNPEAKDDIVEVKWFRVATLKASNVVKKHRPLLEMLFRKQVDA